MVVRHPGWPSLLEVEATSNQSVRNTDNFILHRCIVEAGLNIVVELVNLALFVHLRRSELDFWVKAYVPLRHKV